MSGLYLLPSNRYSHSYALYNISKSSYIALVLSQSFCTSKHTRISYFHGLTNIYMHLINRNIIWYLQLCLMVAQILKWKYTPMPPKVLGTILVQKYAAGKHFYPQCTIARSLIMHNKVTQLQLVKYWPLWKLSGIGNHTCLVRSLLCVWTTTNNPLQLSSHK